MSAPEDDYLCVGVCFIDPDSGCCLGCGRPPLDVSISARKIAANDVDRYPVASEFSPEIPDDSQRCEA
jgi:hypothetical protein